MQHHRPTEEPFRWQDVSVHEYKEKDEPGFSGITRQTLFEGEDGVPCETRYFEVDPGGYSSLERHAHPHHVVILRGRGRALVDPHVTEVGPFDLIRVPSGRWHQFYAAPDQPLGFLCMVPCERDRPTYPSEADLEALRGRIDPCPAPLKPAARET